MKNQKKILFVFGFISITACLMGANSNQILNVNDINDPFLVKNSSLENVVRTLNELKVNDYITSAQGNPSICTLSEDLLVVVWESSIQDTNGEGVYAKVINAKTGNNMTAEFRVNNYIVNDQDNPAVCALSNDSFVVVWESSFQDTNGAGVYATVINATTGNNMTAEFRVNNYITNDQDNPSVCALSDDSFVVVWESSFQDTNGAGVYATVINATTGNNMTAEFRVNSYITNDQDNPSVCALSSDTFAVAWESNLQDTNGVGVYGTVINATTGNILTAEFRINTYITNDQDNPSVCALSNDTFVVAWESNLQDTSGEGVYATIINATTGNNMTAEFQVNNYVTNSQARPSICALSSDTFAVAWDSNLQDTSGAGVYATIFNATTGNNMTAEFQVNKYIVSSQDNPSICALSNISFAVAWESLLQDTNGEGVYTGVFFIDNAPIVNNPTPADGAAGINNNPTIQVNIFDADGEDMTVLFYDNSTGLSILIGTDSLSGGGPGITSIIWNGLINRTEYKWYVMVSDGIVNTTSIMWSFITHYIVYDEEPHIPGYDLLFLLCIAVAATLYLIRKRYHSTI